MNDSFVEWRSRFRRLHLDLGCGDARFALREARTWPDVAVAGIDTCLDNARVPRRSMPAILRLIEAGARNVAAFASPRGVDRITVNFPYGSLLRWIVDEGVGFVDRVSPLVAPGGTLEIRINASALVEIGVDAEDIAERLVESFAERPGWSAGLRWMERDDLRAFPSTWAKRIGYGRETTAMEVVARRRA